VFVRRIRSNLNCTDTDSFLTIRAIRINFNNQSGLLGTFTPQQLYQATISDGGINNLTWGEFTGAILSCYGGNPGVVTDSSGYNAWPYTQYSGVGAGTFTSQGATGLRLVPTTGTILSLAFGSTIALPEEYYAPGSIGQFSLQVQVDVANLTKDTWTNYELVVAVQNPGVIITDRGSSSTFVGLLTKDAVLQTKDESEHITLAHAHHIVGGSIWSKGLNALRWVHDRISPTKEWIKNHINHPVANKAVEIAEKLGYGMSGGTSKLQNRLM
jgi:hypothetical protein